MAQRSFQAYYQVSDPSLGSLSIGSLLGSGSFIVTNGGGTTALTTNDNLTAQPLSGPPKQYTGYTYGNGIIITDGSTYWLYTDDVNLQNTTASSTNSGNLSDISAVCYLRGTMILTNRGQVPIEELNEGDLVVTKFGGFQPVRWVGYQRFDSRILGIQGAPICFHPGSLGKNMPHRQLRVSPGHAVVLDGHLVAASLLVNDVTITQDATHDIVEYFHIDLPRHDCVLADGAWGETYWENAGNRVHFHNASDFGERFPDHDDTTKDTCMPYVNQGDDKRLPALRALVTPKLTQEQLTGEADLHIIQNGERIALEQISAGTWEARLTSTSHAVEIRSLTMRPSMDAKIESNDHRSLGVCIYELALRTATGIVPLPIDHPALKSGFHGIERKDRASWRWTCGQGVIPRILLDEYPEAIGLILRASLLPQYNRGTRSNQATTHSTAAAA